MRGPEPISAAAFARAIETCGPFGAAPQLAVAVSGGADSMALALLSDQWVRGQGGRIVALTVDHGLRAEAAAEARTVGRWMAARGIAHHILRWEGAKPREGIQAAARAARYDLLIDWCRRHGALHLLVAHHADDQAETVRMREMRRSGIAGLAGMAALTPPPVAGPLWPLVLRPLLEFTRTELVATLEAAGQPWLDDPSNENTAFTRIAVRRALAGDAAERQRLLELAARARDESERVDAAVLAAAAQMISLHPAGVAVVERRLFDDLPDDEARQLWARILVTIGGAVYPPRGAGLDRLVQKARDPSFGGLTLGGCRITTGPRRLTVTREAAAVRVAMPYKFGMVWDGRFTLQGDAPRGAVVRRLGAAGLRQVRAELDPALADLPAMALQALPALYADEKLIMVPRLVGFTPHAAEGAAVTACFTPRRTLFP